MEDNGFFDSFFDGLNLTVQWQPSSTIDVNDSGLTNQVNRMKI